MNNTRNTTRYMAKVSILSALSFLIMLLEFPLPLLPAFLKIDLSEIPVLLGTFALGPLAGLAIELVKNLLHLTISSTAGIGELANFLVGSAFVHKYSSGREDAPKTPAFFPISDGTIFISSISISFASE